MMLSIVIIFNMKVKERKIKLHQYLSMIRPYLVDTINDHKIQGK